MIYIIVYKTGNFEAIEKNDKKSAFALPGDYCVFEEIEMIKQYGRSYKDPFIYFREVLKIRFFNFFRHVFLT
ncbi:MAG: hypothetical protein WCL21_18835, partial [Mariniphaga sp.]